MASYPNVKRTISARPSYMGANMESAKEFTFERHSGGASAIFGPSRRIYRLGYGLFFHAAGIALN
jgi:hypothetical protein